jgi:hypothetical protein
MYLRTCGSFKSTNRKGSHLRMVRESDKLCKSANMRIWDVTCAYFEIPTANLK